MATVKKKPKKQFDWDKFRQQEIAVHLQTEKEAKAFSEILHAKGFHWAQSGSCLNYPHCKKNPARLCFFGYINRLTYGDIRDANKNGVEICMFSAYDFS